jgi:hypothetical protein
MYICCIDEFSNSIEWNAVPQYCTTLRVLIFSDHQLYRVTPLKTPFGLLIPLLQSQSHITTITHNYLLRCDAFTQL